MLVFEARKYDHVTPLMRQLHWLPVKERIVFKILLLTYKSLNDIGPSYLADLLTVHRPTRALRSGSDGTLLTNPNSRLKNCGDRTFHVAAPKLWNSLPRAVRMSVSQASFKTSVKTILFNGYYG